jgi:hypothetical protein
VVGLDEQWSKRELKLVSRAYAPVSVDAKLIHRPKIVTLSRLAESGIDGSAPASINSANVASRQSPAA